MRNMYSSQLFLALLVLGSSCRSQPSSPFAPESGVYTGSTLNVTGTMNYTYNPITGFGVQPGTHITPGINLAGDMTITNKGNNKGTYSLSKLANWKGEWQYDPATDKLSFTGPAKEALRYYHAGKGYYSLTFVIQSKPGSEGVTYYFNKKVSKAFPKPTKPNGAITGLFTVKPDLNTVAFFDAATAKIQTSFNGKESMTNHNHYTLSVGFTDNSRYYQINLADPTGKIKQYTSSQILSYNWAFSNYQFGILNTDQTKMALLGKIPDSYHDLTYTPGDYAIGIFDLNGQTLGMLPIEYSKYIIPAFLPDGRLVYCPKEGGIALSAANYKNSKTIYSNPINALAVSPDGKMIAFSEGIHFYTMNLDGSNKKQVVCDGEKLEANSSDNVITMAWAPDGRHLAVSYKTSAKYGILIVPLDGGSYRFLKDEDGEMYEHTGQIISWH